MNNKNTKIPNAHSRSLGPSQSRPRSKQQAHNGGKNRALETGTSVDLSVDVDDYNACLAIINA